MIRRTVLAPLASWLRAVGRALPVGPVWEILTESTLYMLGWLMWVLEWIPRAPALGLAMWGRLPPASIVVHPTLLQGGGADSGADIERAERLCAEASALLEPHGVALWWDAPTVARAPGGLPRCSIGGLFSRFFFWASARSDARALTVYLVDDLGALAGCSFPGADWVLVDVHSDGSTLVHELGHLADLWPHTKDPHNLMTDRPGGSQNRLTRFQTAMIRTSRFARSFRIYRTPSGVAPYERSLP